jgi:hypothetical protein
MAALGLPLLGKAAANPNIVIVLADDFGYGDAACFDPQFSKIPTPNIDRLGGIREMGTGRDAEKLAGDKLPEYFKIWQESLILTITPHDGYYEITLRLTLPEVLVITVR